MGKTDKSEFKAAKKPIQISRRNFAKLGLAGIAGIASALAQGCSNPLRDLQYSLGKRWTSLSEQEKQDFLSTWQNASEHERKILTVTYSNPKKTYNSFTNEQKKSFERFNPSEEQIERYHETLPWIKEKLTKEDRILIYGVESLGEVLRSR